MQAQSAESSPSPQTHTRFSGTEEQMTAGLISEEAEEAPEKPAPCPIQSLTPHNLGPLTPLSVLKRPLWVCEGKCKGNALFHSKSGHHVDFGEIPRMRPASFQGLFQICVS